MLLGAGESGKSTVVKQMRLLYGADYTEVEKESFRLSIHQNIIETMEILCDAVIEKNPYDSLTYTYVKLYLSFCLSVCLFQLSFFIPANIYMHTCSHMNYVHLYYVYM